MKRIYIAGPMSGLPDLNYPAFNAMAAKLRGQGHHVENPAENTASDSWEGYMRMAIAQLITCDTLMVLPGWQKSRGACIEIRLANDLGIEVKFAEDCMKQPNDTKTLDMLPNGFPAFELDHEHPWTLPPAKPYTPAPRTGWPPGMLQDDCRELSKWFASRLNAVRRLGA